MDNKQFVKLIRDVVREPSIQNSHRKLRKQRWFAQLEQEQQEKILAALADAVDASLWSILNLLEGTSVDEDGNPLAAVQLFWDDGKARHWLTDPDGTGLHDWYYG